MNNASLKKKNGSPNFKIYLIKFQIFNFFCTNNVNLYMMVFDIKIPVDLFHSSIFEACNIKALEIKT